MPKTYEYDELSEDAQARARFLMRHDEGYRQAAEEWERECAEGGVVSVLNALGFQNAKYSYSISGNYIYKKAADVKKALDDCPYANEEIYAIWKKLIAVQRRYKFELSADVWHGNIDNVYRGYRYEDAPDFEDTLRELDAECVSIVTKAVEWIDSDEYLADECRANVPGGYNKYGEEADPFGIYHANGQRVGKMNENIDPYRRRFNRVG